MALPAPRNAERLSWIFRSAYAATFLLCAPALAAPLITSAPYTTGAVGVAWTYDDNEGPTATGQAPFNWELITAPTDMRIDNLDATVYWIPDTIGLVDIEIRVTDASGESDSQVIAVDVTDGEGPSILLDFAVGELLPGDVSPYQYDVGSLAWLTEDQQLDFESQIPPRLAAAGTEPIFYWADPSPCLTVLSNGMYALASPVAGPCEIVLHATNWIGEDEATLIIDFEERPSDSGLVVASLEADRIEASAPEIIAFDGTASIFPDQDVVDAAGSSWQTLIYFSSGDPNDEIRTIDSLQVEWEYEIPGSYEARLVLWANSRLADVPFLPGALAQAAAAAGGGTSEVTLISEAVLPITITADGRKPPVTTLTAIALTQTGEPYPALTADAPLTVEFSSGTTLGDGQVKLQDGYVLAFGDGNERRPIITEVFADPAPISHIYSAPGHYTARITITTEEEVNGRLEELTGTAEVDIMVLDEGQSPPLSQATAAPSRGEVPLTVRASGQTGDTDGYVVSRVWTLPDGTTSTEDAPVITLDEPGTHTLRLTVTDNDGLVSNGTATVRVTRDGVLPPKVVSIPERNAIVGSPYIYSEAGAAVAQGGGPYQWSLGKEVQGATVNAPAGMTIDERTGAIAWTPTADQAGEVAVTIVVANVAGIGLQEFIVSVSAAPDTNVGGGGVPSSGCGCATDTQAATGPLWLGALGMIFFGRRRRSSKRC